MFRASLFILLGGLLTGPALAQEKFTIKLKKDAKGDVIKNIRKQTDTGKSSAEIMGKAQSKDEERIRSSTYTEVIIDKTSGNRASKLERVYEKAELTNDGKKITPGFLGKTVLIERTGASYKFTVDGKELTGDDAAYLSDEFSSKQSEKDDAAIERLFIPKQAVAVNEAWKLDLAGISKELGEEAKMTFDLAKSTGSGKLTKAYQKDGKQFGVIEIEMDLVLTKIGEGDRALQMDAGSRMKANLRLDACIDGSLNQGSMESTMEMKMSGALKGPDGGAIKIESNSKHLETKVHEDLTGKK